MKKSIILQTLFHSFLLLSFSFQTEAQDFLKANGKFITNQKGEKIILRGMGLGGWMLQEGYMLRVRNIGQQQHVIKGKIEELIGAQKTEEFYNRWQLNHMRKIDVDSMAAWGFNSIRLPMHYNLFTLPVEKEPVEGKHTWIEKGFTMTDSLLSWCRSNKIYLILDLHAAPGGQGNDVNISDRDESKPSLWESQANRKKTIALWEKLAERYKNDPWIGGYDIINEPNWGFVKGEHRNGCEEKNNIPLKNFLTEATTAIRKIDKNHIIIIEGNCWGNNYDGMFPLWDDNLVVSFHKYWNHNNLESIQKFIDIREKYNVPVWLGESGENSDVWFRDAIKLCESNEIGWAWWPLKKLGFNNPLEVKVNSGYQKILDFWTGEGEWIAPNEAYSALMEQAENLKLENCIYHKEVIDAMFRQVNSDETVPFKNNLISDNSILNSVDFDLGRHGFAYWDKDEADYHISTGTDWVSWNKGRVYRNDGVDIERDKTSGFFVTNFETGEWLQYSVKIENTGIYTLEFSVSSDNENGKINVTLNNNSKTETVTVPKTGDEQNWKTVEIKNIKFEKGNSSIKVFAENGGFAFKSIKFVKTNN